VTAVGWIGLGKLGAPCAAALAHEGKHTVWGYDVRGVDAGDYDWSSQPPIELVDSIDAVVRETDAAVFVAVQTPHLAAFGGESTLRDEPVDFEYQYLVNAVRDVCNAALHQGKEITLVVVSTVLPGTFDRYLRPLLNEYVTPVYHPFFIAMGTVVEDFVNPEMTLFGVDRAGDEDVVRGVYATLHGDPIPPAPALSIPSAELAKVGYNTFITAKIVFANTLAQLAEYTGADVDEVTDALALATDRLISPRYLRAGMGDGGACHPRDNIALAALANRYGVRGNYFKSLIAIREAQSEWLSDVVQHWARLTNLPIAVLGQAYKPEVAIDAGSPALLLIESLRLTHLRVTVVDPIMRPDDHDVLFNVLLYPHVYVVATAHQVLLNQKFTPGSVVIDPFGAYEPQPGVTLVTPGRRRRRPRVKHQDGD